MLPITTTSVSTVLIMIFSVPALLASKTQRNIRVSASSWWHGASMDWSIFWLDRTDLSYVAITNLSVWSWLVSTARNVNNSICFDQRNEFQLLGTFESCNTRRRTPWPLLILADFLRLFSRWTSQTMSTFLQTDWNCCKMNGRNTFFE